MKFMYRWFSVSMLALTAISLPVLAKSSASEPVFNPATVVSVWATVVKVSEVPAGTPLEGVHIAVKTKTETLDVYLGPTSFIKMLKTDFRAGDQIDVTGSKVRFENADVILTSEVTQRNTTLILRDATTGAPAWKTWGVSADSL